MHKIQIHQLKNFDFPFQRQTVSVVKTLITESGNSTTYSLIGLCLNRPFHLFEICPKSATVNKI